jgi:hypothetical protein
MLRCTCSELRGMRVSWQDHSIDNEMRGSLSAISWLDKNIVSMRQLSLRVFFSLPQRFLQDLMGGGR